MPMVAVQSGRPCFLTSIAPSSRLYHHLCTQCTTNYAESHSDFGGGHDSCSTRPPWRHFRRGGLCTNRCYSLDTHFSTGLRVGSFVPCRDGSGIGKESLARSFTSCVFIPCFIESECLTRVSQSAGFLLTAGGYLLGHSHKGRSFSHSAHGTFANIMFAPMALQLVLGVYLKLHIHEQSIRPYAVKAHSIVGKSYPILGWVQMLFGAIVFRGYCLGGHLGQCLAHYIMGSGFIAYGTIIAIMMLVGEGWVRRSGRSPEFWDSRFVCCITYVPLSNSLSNFLVLSLLGWVQSMVAPFYPHGSSASDTFLGNWYETLLAPTSMY